MTGWTGVLEKRSRSCPNRHYYLLHGAITGNLDRLLLASKIVKQRVDRGKERCLEQVFQHRLISKELAYA